MNIAGIDYSITSPGICSGDVLHSFGRKSWQGWHADNKIHVSEYPIYSCEEERHHKLSMWAMGILKAYDIEFVCMEGYSMGSKGRVFNLAENAGHLKKCMWMSGIEFIEVPPMTLKKFATEDGRADKSEMVKKFCDNTGLNMREIFPNKSKNIPSMITDIADAYWCREYGRAQKETPPY